MTTQRTAATQHTPAPKACTLCTCCIHRRSRCSCCRHRRMRGACRLSQRCMPVGAGRRLGPEGPALCDPHAASSSAARLARHTEGCEPLASSGDAPVEAVLPAAAAQRRPTYSASAAALVRQPTNTDRLCAGRPRRDPAAGRLPSPARSRRRQCWRLQTGSARLPPRLHPAWAVSQRHSRQSAPRRAHSIRPCSAARCVAALPEPHSSSAATQPPLGRPALSGGRHAAPQRAAPQGVSV